METLFDSDEWGGDGDVPVSQVWEAIEAVVSRAELRAALHVVNEIVPPPDAHDEADDWRIELIGRFATVSGFVKQLTTVIEFGANAEGTAVLAAMKALWPICPTRKAGVSTPAPTTGR